MKKTLFLLNKNANCIFDRIKRYFKAEDDGPKTQNFAKFVHHSFLRLLPVCNFRLFFYLSIRLKTVQPENGYTNVIH